MSSIKIKVKKEVIEKIEEICKSFDNKPGELINVLHKTQEYLGYLPAEAQEIIARELNISAARVYGVVSFYSFFSLIPKGKCPVSVCMGTACYVRGAEKIVDEFKKELNIGVGETDSEGLFSLASLRCVGACGLAPVVLVGEKVHGRLAADDVKHIVKEHRDQSAKLVEA